jgi:hypothetical protein
MRAMPGQRHCLWGEVCVLISALSRGRAALTRAVWIFLLAGLLTIDPLWQALLPAGLYLGFHLIEGETVTPMLLARRFDQINKVVHDIWVALSLWARETIDGYFSARIRDFLLAPKFTRLFSSCIRGGTRPR